MQPGPDARISHALPHEIAPAFHLLLRHLDPQERHNRVARALDLIRAGRMNTQGIFVLRGTEAAGAGSGSESHLGGVIIGEPVAGAGAILWPPVVDDPQRQDFEDLLVQEACAWLRQSARLAQCLLPREDSSLAVPLLRNGFQLITTLSYLRHDPNNDTRISPVPLRFEPYDQDSPTLFHETLVRTYENTLDCPEVNGVRTIEEVIQGHQAQGEFDPNLWWLASAGDSPVGVMMVNVVNPGQEWEVGYMGIVPTARRHGFGCAMLRKVLDEARAQQISRITLCVDDRNVPAWNLYRRLGFTSFDQRMVFLAVWQCAG